jgi:hypothetical protein
MSLFKQYMGAWLGLGMRRCEDVGLKNEPNYVLTPLDSLWATF